MAEDVDELKRRLQEVTQQLSVSQSEVIHLSEKCVQLMSADLNSVQSYDSLSLGSDGYLAESDSVEIKKLKEKLIKVKQNEEILKSQVEVLEMTQRFLLHPDDVKKQEETMKNELAVLRSLVQKLEVNKGGDNSQFEELRKQLKYLTEANELKSQKIEELHDQLDKCAKHNEALAESLVEVESSEKSLRASLDRCGSADRLEDVLATSITDYEQKETRLLKRLESMEDKDSRLRGRLTQLEEMEQQLREELQSSKEKIQYQETTIIQLQNQISQSVKPNDMEDLQKKYSNLKLILSQKMDELKLAREISSSQEQTIKQLQDSNNCSEQVRTLQEQVLALSQELSKVKEVNQSQADRIDQLQMADSDAGISGAYEEFINKQLNMEQSDELIAEQEQEIVSLKAMVESLAQNIESLKTDHVAEETSMKRKIAELEEEAHSSASKLRIAQNLIDELKSQNKKLSSENKKEYEEQIKDLSQKLQAERVQNSVHREVIESLSPKIEQLNCENEALETRLQSAKEKVSSYESELSKKRIENDSQKMRMSQLERRLEESKAESDNIAVDLIQMTDKCAQLEMLVSSAQQNIESISIQRDELEAQSNELRQRLASLEQPSTQPFQTSPNNSVVNNIKVVLNHEEEEETCYLQKVLKAELMYFKKLTVDLEESLNSKDGGTSPQDELKSHLLEISRLKEQNFEKTNICAQLQVENSSLIAASGVKDCQIAGYCQEVSALQASIDNLKIQNAQKAEEADILSKQLKECQSGSNNHEKSLIAMSKHKDDLANELFQKNNEFTEMCNEFTKQSESLFQISKKLSEVESLQQQTASDNRILQLRNDNLVLELDKIISEKQICIEEIDSLQSAKNSLSEELESMHVEYERCMEELDSHSKKFEQSIEHNEKQLNDRLIQITGLESSVETMSAENNQLKSQLEQIQSENKQLQHALQAHQDHLTGHVLQLQMFLDNAQTETNNSNSLHSYGEELNKCISVVKKYKDEDSLYTQSLKDKMSDLLLKHQSLSDSLEQIEAENKTLKILAQTNDEAKLEQTSGSEINVLKANIEGLAAKAEKLADDLISAESHRDIYLNDLQTERHKRDIAEKELETFKEEQLTFKESLGDLKEQYERLQVRYDELLTELEQAKLEIAEKQNCLKILEGESNVLQQQLETIKSNNRQFSADAAQYKEQVGILELELAQLTKKLADEEGKHLETKKLLDDLVANQQQNQSDSDAEESSVQEQNRELLHRIEIMTRENCDLSGRVADLYEQIDEMSSNAPQLDTNETERCQLGNSLSTAEKRISELTNALNVMESSRRTLMDELQGLKDAVEGMSEVEQENLVLKNLSEQHVTEISSLKDQLSKSSDKVTELQNSVELNQACYSADALAVNNKVTTLQLAIKAKDDFCQELQSKIVELDESLRLTKDELELLRITSRQEYNSIKEKFMDASNSLEERKLELHKMKEERDSLHSQMPLSPGLGEDDLDGVEYQGLHHQVIEFKQQIQKLNVVIRNLEADKRDCEKKLEIEKDATMTAETEVEKLQSSIELLMSAHHTEIMSLQNALQDASATMADLEAQVNEYAKHQESLQQISSELGDIDATKESLAVTVTSLAAEIVQPPSHAQSESASLEEKVSSFVPSPDASPDHPVQYSIPPSSLYHGLRPPSNISTSSRLPYQQTKENTVEYLSCQSKQELLLQKKLEDCYQSLAFYRSAIDNIISCLGADFPDLKKWTSSLGYADNKSFSSHLESLIRRESELQRRVHDLETSERAMIENFDTKEQEYRAAMIKLEDMVAVLKTAKSLLADELKSKSSSSTEVAETTIDSLRTEIYELQKAAKRLELQNEELRFAYEQECDRSQYLEEERIKADKKARENLLEASRENEYRLTISSYETKIANLLATQRQLELTIENLKRDSREEDLRTQIDNLEREKRTLLRKLEVLQQTRGTSDHFDISLDKPEDVLKQRIWELEKVEAHLRQQLSDLEHDREELHEIARQDKSVIHELNIKIAEALLSNKNLKAHLTRVEQAEESLMSKLECAESRIIELEDKLKQTMASENATRYHLEDVEYSEDNLKFRTVNLERTLEELQENEVRLKKIIDDLNKNQTQLLKEEMMRKSRLQDCEAEQADFRARLLDYENREITYKARLNQLAAIEEMLLARVRELEADNEKLRCQVMLSESSTAGLRDNLSATSYGSEELRLQLDSYRETEKLLKAKISGIEEEKFQLEKKFQDINFDYLQLKLRSGKDEVNVEDVSKKLTAALASENQMKIKIRKMEAVIAAYESKETSGVVQRENFLLISENKNLKEKVESLRTEVKELKDQLSKVHQGNIGSYMINKLQDEIKELKAGLSQSEILRPEPVLKLSRSQQKDSSNNVRTAPLKRGDAETSIRSQCLKELVSVVAKREVPALDDTDKELLDVISVEKRSCDRNHDFEVASQSSLWDQLEEPVRLSRSTSPYKKPIRTQTTDLPSVPVHEAVCTESLISNSEVAEESSLWDKLELYEPKDISTPRAKIDLEFDEGPIAPIYAPRKAPDALLAVENQLRNKSEEAEDKDKCEGLQVDVLEEKSESVFFFPTKDSPTLPPQIPAEAAALPLSPLAVELLETKDIIRLKNVITDLEKKLKSRDTEIRILKIRVKEVEKESERSGDLISLKAKLKELQEQLESADKKIFSLRNEIISRDKSLENQRKDNMNLQLQLKKLTDSLSCSEDQQKQTNESQRELEEKNRKIMNLEQQLREKTKSSNNADAIRMKYLDDKYTDAAIKYQDLLKNKEELQKKFDELLAEHSKCPQNVNEEKSEKCEICKLLKQELKRQLKKADGYKRMGTKKAGKKLSSKKSEESGDSFDSTAKDKSGSEILTSDKSGSDQLEKDITSTTNTGLSEVTHTSIYEVINDYNPQYFSTSGRVSEELSLHKGQLVRVSGSPDKTGYCTAEVNRQFGLVPIKYLQKIEGRDSQVHPKSLVDETYFPDANHTVSTPVTSNRSPGDIQRAHYTPNVRPQTTHLPTKELMASSPTSRKPQAPSDLSVEIIANRKVYVQWSYLPYLDHLARSNGTPVSGFRVFLNGRPSIDIPSPYTHSTSIDVAPEQLRSLHTVSIQALGSSSLNSALTHATVTIDLHSNLPHQRQQTLTGGKMKRLFVAYYDYDPATQGPFSRGMKSMYSDELKLRTGDFLVVYGDPLPNGFYNAEVNGRRGLAPEAFIRQLPAENANHFGSFDNNNFLLNSISI